MSANSALGALSHYRELPKQVGWGAMVVAFVARLPYAMLPLGVMTAFTASSGDLAVGGLAAGVFSIAVAICSPLVGRAADAWGQRKVLLTLVPVNSVALAALYWAASTGASTGVVLAICAAAGATIVPVGSFMRARWVQGNPTARILNAAFSYESMADELVFVLGPALVGIAASLAAPAAPLALSFGLMATVGTGFALGSPREDSTQTIPHGERVSILQALVRVFPAMIALACVGTFFGASQAGTTARAELAGAASQAGLVYAVMGIGSAIAALAVVVLPASFRLSSRFLVFGSLLAGSIFLAAQAPNLAATAWALALAGFFVGPTLVTAFRAAEVMAPTGGISVAMTLMQSAVTIGVSIGSAAGGAVAQEGGARPAFLLACAASGLVVVVGLFLSLPLFRRQHKDI